MLLQPSWSLKLEQGLSQAIADPPCIRSHVAPSHQGKLLKVTCSIVKIIVRALAAGCQYLKAKETGNEIIKS